MHKLVAKFHARIHNLDEDEVFQRMQSDSSFKHRLLVENGHIITNYFHVRTINYKNTVLKELYDWTDIWLRDEFAKSRGQIHDHDIIYSKTHHSKVYGIMSSEVDITEKARLLQEWLQSNHEDSPNIVSMHPAGGQFDDNDEWVPNKEKWVKHEGLLSSNSNVLKTSLSACDTDEKKHQFQIDVVNKCMLHGCSSYCLKPDDQVKDKDKDKSNEPPVLKCRFHYGIYDRKTKTSSGKDVSLDAKITTGDNPRYEGPRDHPRLQHVAARPLSWLANCDSSIIVHQNLLALNNYLTGYACKGAKTTAEMISTFKTILDQSPADLSLQSLGQKTMLKAVGCVDTPAPAADYFNTGSKPITTSRLFRRIGLSGFKILEKNKSKDGTLNATKSNALDSFLGKKRREQYADEITLYEWACICNCPKNNRCGAEHIPVFTGCKNICTWPVTEDYARTQLMIFSPGTWYKPEDTLTVDGVTYEDYTSAFAAFIDKREQCPKALRDMLK